MNDSTNDLPEPGRHPLGLRLRLVRPELGNQKGAALLTVMIFAFIFVIGTLAFFAVAGYEAAQTEIRQDSTRAFFLAEGAIERAKARLLDDGRWRAGFDSTAQDGGGYRLDVRDSLYQGENATWFYSEGFYGRTKRDVEVWAQIHPPSLDLAIHASRNIDLRGNVCLQGYAHANGTVSGGNHFQCGGTNITTYDSGYNVDPPVMYTEPDSFPGMTYYYVTVKDGLGGADTLRILDRDRAVIGTYVFPVRPHPDFDWSYNPGQRLLSIDFNPNVCLAQTGAVPFPRAGGDSSVVINFGEPADTTHARTDLEFQQPGGSSFEIESTIVNTRYTGGPSPQDRLISSFWTGGEIRTQTKTIFAPRGCVAVVGQTIRGNASVLMGTPTRPGLTYMMENTDFSNGQWTINGSLISLGDITLGGGTNLNYDRDFIACLPPFLRDNWPIGTSGEMQILVWREPPPRP
jgi:hypothetical protein